MDYEQLMQRELANSFALVRGDSDAKTIYLRGVFLPDAYASHKAAITTKDLEEAITATGIEHGNALRVVVDSVGGDIAVSQWMMHELANYDTTVEVRARLYSAATHMAMGAKRVVGAEGSDYLLHFPWSIALGTAKDFRRYAGELDDTGDALVKQYMKRIKLPEGGLRALMEEDRIINDARALEIGLIDEILPAAQAAQFPNS